jgi:KDO2-lipid IV(A) lauroyltransferase
VIGLKADQNLAAGPSPARAPVGEIRERTDAAGDRAGKQQPAARRPPVLGPGSRALYYLMVAMLHALSLIPDFILYPIGVACGFIAYLLDRRHVKIGLKNLSFAFPDRPLDERKRILRASYVNLGRAGAEYIRMGGFFYRRLKERVGYDRLEYFHELKARDPKRGILVLSAHFGNFELLAIAHAMHGYPISLVHHTQRFLAGDAIATFVRDRAGVDTLRKHSAARAVLRALKDGGVIGIPFDQNAKRSEALFLPFFGEPASTTSGLARIAVLSGAAVVPAFIVRQPDNRSHRIMIHDEIPLQRSGEPERDIEENTRRFLKAVEDTVRRYPEQFLWTHRRYKTRPRGMAPVYDETPRHRHRDAAKARA